MDPVTKAILTSVGSDLGSAVIGKIFGGKKSRPDPVAEQIRLDHQQLTKKFKWAVEGAQKAGLHPLFALGGNAMASTPVPIDGTREAAGVAVDVGKAVRAGQAAKWDEEEKKMARERHFFDVLESQSRRRYNDAQADYVMKQARDSEVQGVIRNVSSRQDGKALASLWDPRPGRDPQQAQKTEDKWAGLIAEADALADFIGGRFTQGYEALEFMLDATKALREKYLPDNRGKEGYGYFKRPHRIKIRY